MRIFSFWILFCLLSCHQGVDSNESQLLSSVINEFCKVIKDNSYPMHPLTLINPCIGPASNNSSLESDLSKKYEHYTFAPIEGQMCILDTTGFKNQMDNFSKINFKRLEKTGLSSLGFIKKYLNNKGYIQLNSIYHEVENTIYVIEGSYVCAKHCGFDLTLIYHKKSGDFILVDSLRADY